ncbi:MAG: class I SAM-dependent methyltransferase, partial [Bacteroidales bacterium]|nr:class I SAM-dependent methyltransferase [Bacteroidales bacterium]
MQFSFNGFIYRSLIDPMLSGIRRSIVDHIRPEDHVLDVACGTGALAVAMAGHASHVTGIDLSEDMIVTARRTAASRKLNNVSFELLDATDLSCYTDRQYDVAVATLA